jgi:hypothetical protein
MNRVEDSAAATASGRMKIVHDNFLTRGRPPIGTGRHATATEAPAPLDLDILDYIEAKTAETIAFTHQVAPDADRAPREPSEVPRWAVEATATAGPYEQQARDALLYKQALESALLMGEKWRIRRHPCPRCETWALFITGGRIVCAHTRCTGDDGLASTWTTAQIAHAHVANSNHFQQNAT